MKICSKYSAKNSQAPSQQQPVGNNNNNKSSGNINNGPSGMFGFPPGFGGPNLFENGKIFHPPLMMPPETRGGPPQSHHHIQHQQPTSSQSHLAQPPPQQQPSGNKNNRQNQLGPPPPPPPALNPSDSSSALKQLRDIADRSTNSQQANAVAAAASMFGGGMPNQHLLNEFTKIFESQVTI